jgi:hypothetical protein
MVKISWNEVSKKVIILFEAIDYINICLQFLESGCLGMQPQLGDKSHLKLNTSKRPIAYKYREGKVKRTLNRELKVLEIANRETF